MLARRVYEKLNTEQNKLIISRIKHHFSVCGVSTYDELSGPQRKLISSLESRIWKAVATWVAKLVQMRYFDILSWGLIRDNIFARMSEENSAKLRNAWKVKHPEFVQDPDQVDIGKHQVRLHQNRGRNSVKTESHFDIFHTIYEQRIITWWYTTPPSTILYSPNDPTYSKPQRNAEVNSTFYQWSRVREIHERGHVDVVFQSEKYLEPIEEILDEIWNNEWSQRE